MPLGYSFRPKTPTPPQLEQQASGPYIPDARQFLASLAHTNKIKPVDNADVKNAKNNDIFISDYKKTALNTLKLASSLVEKISESAPVPGLKGAFSSLNLIIERFDKASENSREMALLSESINDLNHILENVSPLRMSSSFRAQVQSLNIQLNGSLDEIEKLGRHGKFRKVIEAMDDFQTIASLFRKTRDAVDRIIMASTLETSDKVSRHLNMALMDKLPRSEKARHDYVQGSRCLEGTRTKILADITNWATTADEKQVYWLNGGAGTGKTTIALTIAHLLEENPNIHIASFFCSRDFTDRSNMELIFPTLAYLLASHDTEFHDRLVEVLVEHPGIGHALLSEQIKRLLIEPIKKMASHERPIILIIDALDECKGDHAPEKVLAALAQHVHSVPFLKIFVSSRPTSSVNSGFSDDALRRHRRVFILHEVESELVDADIRLFLVDRLQSIAKSRKLNIPGWPPKSAVEKLVKKSGSLFIFAFTASKFIESPGDIERRLADIAGLHSSDHEGRLGINLLYAKVLEDAIAEFPEDQTLYEFRLILATIVLLQNPLSSKDVGELLGHSACGIRDLLVGMHSVLVVPEDDNHAIHTMHASFHDFLIDENRASARVVVHPASYHRTITIRLLQCMIDSLTRNICRVDSVQLNKEVEDMATRRQNYISGSLEYATRYWADHLAHVSLEDDSEEDTDELITILDRFAHEKLLCWIEILSLLDATGAIVTALHKVKVWLSVIQSPGDDLLDILNDGYRASLEYFDVIKESASSIYNVVLPLIPTSTRLSEIYWTETGPLTVPRGRENQWGACLRTIGNYTPSHSVVFSSDGSQLISAHYGDGIRLWDARTGELKMFMEDKFVSSVAVLQDGFIVSGGFYETEDNNETVEQPNSEERDELYQKPSYYKAAIQLWDAETGLSKGFVGELDRLSARADKCLITASIDQKYVALAVDLTPLPGSMVIIWDTRTWKEKRRHHHICSADLFSLSLGCFAIVEEQEGEFPSWLSPSLKRRVEIQDIDAGTLRTALDYRDGFSDAGTVCSPDGSRIAIQTSAAISVFDIASGARVTAPYNFPSAGPSVAFSSDGRHIAAYYSTTIVVWEVGNLVPKVKLHGHSGNILSIVFSPDGQYIASTSEDHTIKVWDLSLAGAESVVEQKEVKVVSVELAPDGSCLACGCEDGTVSLWDTHSSIFFHSWPAGSQCSPVAAVAFSPDGRYLASFRPDRVVKLWLEDAVRVWHVGSRKLQKEFVNYRSVNESDMQGEPPRVALGYSGDGRQLAVATNGIVTIWDTRSWDKLRTLNQAPSESPTPPSPSLSQNGGAFYDNTFSNEPLDVSINIQTEGVSGMDVFETKVRRGHVCLEDGWVLDVDGSRVCLLPEPYWRDSKQTSYGRTLVLCTPNGKPLFMKIARR